MERGIKRVVNGGITYTPDGAMLLGPAPGLQLLAGLRGRRRHRLGPGGGTGPGAVDDRRLGGHLHPRL